MLEYTTLSPGSVTAADITEWYSEFSYKKPLTLWHKNTKLNDDRLVGKMKGLVMKRTRNQPITNSAALARLQRSQHSLLLGRRMKWECNLHQLGPVSNQNANHP